MSRLFYPRNPTRLSSSENKTEQLGKAKTLYRPLTLLFLLLLIVFVINLPFYGDAQSSVVPTPQSVQTNSKNIIVHTVINLRPDSQNIVVKNRVQQATSLAVTGIMDILRLKTPPLPTISVAPTLNAALVQHHINQEPTDTPTTPIALIKTPVPAIVAVVLTPTVTVTATATPTLTQTIPHGWPVQGPISSPFGWRPSIAAQVAAAKAGQPANPTLNGKGGSNSGSTPAAPTTPVVMTRLTPSSVVNATVAPLLIATPTYQPTPTATAIVPTPTSTPLAATPTPTPSPTSTPTATSTPTPSPTTTPAMEFHTGVDIAVPERTEVHATADGVVVFAGDAGDYGFAVFIKHSDDYTTVYGHNSRLLVQVGQVVHDGDIIALSGTTGYSTGPHVHYEIRYRGQAIDPRPFMEAQK